ncbi:tail protein X [Shinella sp. HZN7]|uniref:tail protein X n=1 Tax=Shinella sp. (strain HZN7) TaxID=879274 RepID=UPI0007DA709B|nr:tail protein X [Shinella sp. HZN7]ANH04982.1 hypothetical protein shn_13655 [Shinella sp. HZN7]
MTDRFTGEYFEHKTIAGDRWDLLAYRYYGDPDKQTVLLEANRRLWLDDLSIPPLILPRGLVLKVPVIVEEATNLDALPPWKRANPSYGA